jgi:hypothetical protein
LKRERKKNKKETKQKVGVRRRVLHLFSVFFFTLRVGHGYAFCPAKRRTSSKEEKRER